MGAECGVRIRFVVVFTVQLNAKMLLIRASLMFIELGYMKQKSKNRASSQ